MSLRDDLNTLENALHAYAGSLSLDGSELEALDRLRAALDSLESAQGAVAPKLSPAAEKWLEALPELLEIEANAAPGPWGKRPDGNVQMFANLIDPQANGALIVALRNALHEAAALSTENDKEMK